MQKKNIAAVGQIGIDRPLDVLNRAVVLLGGLGQLGHGNNLVFRHARRVATLGINLTAHDTAATGGHEFLVLVADDAVHHDEHDLVDDEVIGGHFARDNHFTEAPRGVDHDLGAVTVGGVDGHGHARGV